MALDNIILDDPTLLKDRSSLCPECEETENDIKYCLNCGSEITDKFCSHCGQSTSTPSKLKMKNFGKGVVMSFGRLTPGFFNTAKGLILHPWEVMRDHIHGKHISYSPPITMIIQLCLYASIIFTFVDAFFGTDLVLRYNIDEGFFNYKGENEVIRMIDQSVVLSTLLIGMLVSFVVYIAYYRHGARKFNFAEYLSAFVYMYAAISIFDILFTFLYLIPGFDFDVGYLTCIIAVIYSIIVLGKAFPQRKWWNHVFLLMWTGMLLCLFPMIVAIILVVNYL